MQITFECSLIKAPKKQFKWHAPVNGPTTLEDMLKTIRSMGLKPSDVAVSNMDYTYEHGINKYSL